MILCVNVQFVLRKTVNSSRNHYKYVVSPSEQGRREGCFVNLRQEGPSPVSGCVSVSVSVSALCFVV